MNALQIKYGEDFCSYGAFQLEIEWVSEGTSVRIAEYDGYEHIEYAGGLDWVRL